MLVTKKHTLACGCMPLKLATACRNSSSSRPSIQRATFSQKPAICSSRTKSSGKKKINLGNYYVEATCVSLGVEDTDDGSRKDCDVPQRRIAQTEFQPHSNSIVPKALRFALDGRPLQASRPRTKQSRRRGVARSSYKCCDDWNIYKLVHDRTIKYSSPCLDSLAS
jgi:hypothetical protein